MGCACDEPALQRGAAVVWPCSSMASQHGFCHTRPASAHTPSQALISLLLSAARTQMEAALAFPQAKILGRHRFGSCVPTRAQPQLAASLLCCYEGTVDVVLFRNLHRMTTHACCPHSSRFLRGDPQGLPSPWPWMGCGGEGPVWRGSETR